MTRMTVAAVLVFALTFFFSHLIGTFVCQCDPGCWRSDVTVAGGRDHVLHTCSSQRMSGTYRLEGS